MPLAAASGRLCLAWLADGTSRAAVCVSLASIDVGRPRAVGAVWGLFIGHNVTGAVVVIGAVIVPSSSLARARAYRRRKSGPSSVGEGSRHRSARTGPKSLGRMRRQSSSTPAVMIERSTQAMNRPAIRMRP